MADVVPPDVRSRMMAGIRSVNTKPELLLRSSLHRRGFRFRLHDKNLPGKPDLVFPKRRAILFAHGCFWHGHDCHLFRWRKSRQDFWRTKIERNRFVDARSQSALLDAGWRCGIVWECALKGAGRLPADQVISACAARIEGDSKLFELRGLSNDASRSSV